MRSLISSAISRVSTDAEQLAADRHHRAHLAEVALDRALHVRILQLHRQRAAVEAGRAVHLAERGGGGRLQVEAGEPGLPVRPQLGGHPPAHERGGPSAGRWSAARPAPRRTPAAAGRARWRTSAPTFISGPLSRPSASFTARALRASWSPPPQQRVGPDRRRRRPPAPTPTRAKRADAARSGDRARDQWAWAVRAAAPPPPTGFAGRSALPPLRGAGAQHLRSCRRGAERNAGGGAAREARRDGGGARPLHRTQTSASNSSTSRSSRAQPRGPERLVARVEAERAPAPRRRCAAPPAASRSS